MIHLSPQPETLDPVGDSSGLDQRSDVRFSDPALKRGNVVSQDSFDECRDYAWLSIGEDELRKLVIDAVNAGGRRDLLGGGPIYVAIDTPRSFKADAGKGSEVFPVKASRVDAPDRSGVAYEIEMG